MNEGLLIACIAFAAIGYLLAAVAHFSGKKARDEVMLLSNKLQATEAKSATHQLNAEKNRSGRQGTSALASSSEKKTITENQAKRERTHSEELVTLRKEAGQMKAQIAQLKQETKENGARLKDALHSKEVTIFQLEKDKEQLLATLKELEDQNQSRKAKPPVQAVKSDAVPANDSESAKTLEQKQSSSTEMADLKKKLLFLEKNLNSEKEFGAKLKTQIQGLQAELRRWTSAAQDADGKPLEPTLFKKWKDRALTARVQYKMMKQLREMSDIKLTTYQESVIPLAHFVFESTGNRTPSVGPGENTSDRYLAEALYALSRNQKKATAVTSSKATAENSPAV